MSNEIYKEIELKLEWNAGYNTAMVIIKGISFEEAKKTQSTLHEMGKSDEFISGYTQALIAWSSIPF